MPEKDVILARARVLEGYTWALEPEGDGTRWSGKEHGATFELTKPEGQVFEGVDTSSLILTLRGKKEGKGKLRQDFISAFGEPKLEIQARRFVTHTVIWDSAQALPPQQPK